MSERTHAPRVGEVCDVDFDPRIAREQGGIRPALIIPSDYFNRAPNGLHCQGPLTSHDRNLPYQIRVAPPEGGLVRPSVILCDQATSQSAVRILEKRGEVSTDTLERSQRMVAECIGVYA